MEHACPKCGALVEDGTPFCPQCNKPQIRVQSSATEPATPPMPPGTPDEVQPPAEPLRHGITPQHDDRPFMQFPPPPSPARPPGLRLSSARKAALWAGLIAGVGAAVPFAPFIILCMVAAGGMSIAFYMRSEPHDDVRTSSGLKMGALAGLFGFLMYAIVASLSLLSTPTRAAFRSDMATALNQAAARSADPSRAADMIRPFVDRLNTPGGLATMFILMLFFLLIFFVLLSGIGGAIGASLFGHRRH